MHLFVFGLPLVLEVFLYYLFIGILTDRIHIIAARPKSAAPKQPLHFGMKSEDFFGRNVLDRPDYLLGGIRRNTLNQKMNVVPTKINIQKINLITLLYFKTDCLQVAEIESVRTFLPYLIGQTK